MTGRQLLRRPGYGVDIEAVLAACAAHGVAVEINASPWRLDLDWRWHSRALALGCTMSINPDAHSTAELDLTHWGVEMARKGGVPKERVLNCLDTEAIANFLKQRRRAARPGRSRVGKTASRGVATSVASQAVLPTRSANAGGQAPRDQGGAEHGSGAPLPTLRN